jgi:hypothetical protein
MGQCPRFAVHIEKIKKIRKSKRNPQKKKENFQDSLGNSQWKTRKPTTHIKQETVF